MKEVIDRNTDPVNKLLLAGTVPVNKLLLTGQNSGTFGAALRGTLRG